MKRRFLAASVALGVALALTGVAVAAIDWGVRRDRLMADQSETLFGVGQPIAQSSKLQRTQAEALADPTSLVSLAQGLTARVLTTHGGREPDQIAFWPNAQNPTYLIQCNEGNPAHPGLQRINLATGAVTTIMSGTLFCDPVRLTPWGSIVFAEEAGGGPSGGRVYELINPLQTTGVKLDRATGVFSGGTGADNLTALPAMGRAAVEGLAILPNGITYYSYDDDIQGPRQGRPGGSYIKFIPRNLWTPGDPPITRLSQSPLSRGSVYALRVSNGGSYGQGREFGNGRWIPLHGGADPDVEGLAQQVNATGYYRPEDMELDTFALGQGQVRFCGPQTGDEESGLYGQVVCYTDGSVAEATTNTAVPTAEPFEIGGTSRGINMPDNIAMQPGRGNFILHEDAETTFRFRHNNDLWDCLPDGRDQDLLTDGCIRIGTLNDLTAEWTGGIFDASGQHFYVVVEHNISGKALILDITGWG
jgi:hypothetical protein